MKKLCCILLCLVFVLTVSGCAESSNSSRRDRKSDKDDSSQLPAMDFFEEGIPGVGNRADDEMETLAETLLTAHFTGNSRLIEDCMPDVLWDYFKSGIDRNGYSFVEDLDIELEKVGELDSDAIDKVEDEYRGETGIRISIDRAIEYAWDVTMYYHDDGELETDTESNRFGILIVEMDGELYALFKNL